MKAANLTSGNGLLSCLSASSEFAGVAEHLELDDGFLIAAQDSLIDHVYFPLTAVISSLTVLSPKLAVETAVIGHEGMAPLAPFHGVTRAPERVVVQVPGEALRLSVEGFRQFVGRDPDFAAALHRFTVALFTFVGQTSGCNRLHAIEQRCARWLLQTHDRVPGDSFKLTHHFLAQMLGVRRSSVTVAAEALRSAGAISYTRGAVRVLDREKLESRSCVCYGLIAGMYARVLGDGVGHEARQTRRFADKRMLERSVIQA